jgi:hypothetical protein
VLFLRYSDLVKLGSGTNKFSFLKPGMCCPQEAKVTGSLEPMSLSPVSVI